MNKYQALHSFWSGFGLKAYDETSVPDYVTDDQGNRVELEPPYITYETAVDDFDNAVALTASLWYRSTSWIQPTEKCEEIEKTIGRGGCVVPYKGGTLWICKGNPFMQRMSDSSDDMIRRVILNIQAEYIS